MAIGAEINTTVVVLFSGIVNGDITTMFSLVRVDDIMICGQFRSSEILSSIESVHTPSQYTAAIVRRTR